MAIQFQCPKCGAQVKVPDSAAGRMGSCPQCGVKMLVPEVAPPEPEPAGFVPPAIPEPPPQTFAPEPAAFPPIATTPFGTPHQPSVALEVKKRLRARKKKGGGLFVPLFCGAILLGLCGWYYWQFQPKLEGPLEGEALNTPDLVPAVIPKSDMQGPAKMLDAVLTDLAEHPVRVQGVSMEVTMRGTEEGLQIELLEGVKTQFARVDPRQNPAFQKYIVEHGPALDNARRQALSENTSKFLHAWQDYINRSAETVDVGMYRNSVGLTALVTGVGYHLAAIVGRQQHPCVYEDGEGRLYFLLPKNTRSFELKGREVKGVPFFPGTFTVHVKAADAGERRRKALQKPKSLRRDLDEPSSESLNDGEMSGKMGEMSDGEMSDGKMSGSVKKRKKKLPP